MVKIQLVLRYGTGIGRNQIQSGKSTADRCVLFFLCFIQYFCVTYQMKVYVKVLKVMFNPMNHGLFIGTAGGERWNIELMDRLKSV